MQVKICLTGKTGVGKDSFVKIVEEQYHAENIEKIQLASPLYMVQEYIYKLCKIDKDYQTQDGKLLNFLGQHMRTINPKIMELHFLERLSTIPTHANIIICSDARFSDLLFVKQQHFLIINIVADPDVARLRREARGDVTLGDANHSTEKHEPWQYDYELYNNNSIDDYRLKVINVMEQIYDSYRQRN